MSSKTDNQSTRDNHYVPKMYLKQWSTNGHSILTYRLLVHHKNEPLWERTSIKRTACWTDLYTQHNQDKLDEVEHYFGTVETETAPILKKISLGKILSANETATLVEFLIIQKARTPAAMKEHESFLDRYFVEVAGESVRKAQQSIQNGRHRSISREKLAEETLPFPLQPINIDINSEKREVRVEALRGRASFLAGIHSLISGQVATWLRNQNWVIATMPIGDTLPTSDNPVTVFAFNRENGEIMLNPPLKQNGCCVFFPLDPRHALFTEIGSDPIALANFAPDSYQANCFIRAIVINAFRYVYAKEKISNIETIRKRIVNPEIAEAEKFFISQWDKTQRRAEAEFGK